MGNTRNKRARIGQKPRGRQEIRGFKAPQQEKEVAVDAGQEQGVKEPVSEPVQEIDRGDGLEAEKWPVSGPGTLHPGSNIPRRFRPVWRQFSRLHFLQR